MRSLFSLASNAVYSPEGYLLFARDRKLVAQPFDAAGLKVSGDAVTLAEHVVQQWQLDHKADVSVSNTGLLVFRSMGGFDAQLVWRDGSEQRSAFVRTAGYRIRCSRQTRHAWRSTSFIRSLPSASGSGPAHITSDIWILDRATGAATPFTSEPGAEFEPAWSPDGSRIAYASNRRGTLDLYQKNADGTGAEELLLTSPETKHVETWSPDGRFLVYSTVDSKTRFDLWLLPMTGDRTPQPLVRTDKTEHQVQIAPGGRWFAYSSNESGRLRGLRSGVPNPDAPVADFNHWRRRCEMER